MYRKRILRKIKRKINKLMVSMEDREGKNYTNLSLKYFTCFKDIYIL